MINRVWLISSVVAVCLSGLVASCTTTGTTVVSKTAGGNAQSGKRFAVVSQLASVDEAWVGAFGKAMHAELKAMACPFVVQDRSPLAIHSDKVRYAEQLASFSPDLVLVVEPGEGTIDTRGRSLKRKFEAGVFKNYQKRASRELLWRGTVMLEPAADYLTAGDMPALARNLISRLVTDGILARPKPVAATPLIKTGTVPSRSWKGFGK